MATENKPLNELKCRDCAHYKLTGWWDPQRGCEIMGFPVNEEEPACISITPKDSARESRESLTK